VRVAARVYFAGNSAAAARCAALAARRRAHMNAAARCSLTRGAHAYAVARFAIIRSSTFFAAAACAAAAAGSPRRSAVVGPRAIVLPINAATPVFVLLLRRSAILSVCCAFERLRHAD
jgi:hypothetical protein